jgi:hypothetical protein
VRLWQSFGDEPAYLIGQLRRLIPTASDPDRSPPVGVRCRAQAGPHFRISLHGPGGDADAGVKTSGGLPADVDAFLVCEAED